MPLGKFHCDYCDKQFQDTLFARKRHLQSLQHLRAKALWFDSFNDPNHAYPEGLPKGVCNRFVKTGFCQYGDSCKYFHPKNTVQNLNPLVVSAFGDHNQTQSPNFQRNHFVGSSSMPGNMVGVKIGMPLGNLPPSLQPPPDGGYPSLPFVDWG